MSAGGMLWSISFQHALFDAVLDLRAQLSCHCAGLSLCSLLALPAGLLKAWQLFKVQKHQLALTSGLHFACRESEGSKPTRGYET